MTREDYEKLKLNTRAYQNLCNGMGPNGWLGDVVKFYLRALTGRDAFRIVGDLHDIGSLMGGDDSDYERLMDDFKGNLFDDIKLSGDYDMYDVFAAGSAYLAVEQEGKKYFNWGNRIPYEKVLEIGATSNDEVEAKRRIFALNGN